MSSGAVTGKSEKKQTWSLFGLLEKERRGPCGRMIRPVPNSYYIILFQLLRLLGKTADF